MEENVSFPTDVSDKSDDEGEQNQTGNNEGEAENTNGHGEEKSKDEALEIASLSDSIAKLEKVEKLVHKAFGNRINPGAKMSLFLNLTRKILQQMSTMLFSINRGDPVDVCPYKTQYAFRFITESCVIVEASMFNLQLSLEDLKIKKCDLIQAGLSSLFKNSRLPIILYLIKEITTRVRGSVNTLLLLVSIVKASLTDHKTKCGSKLYQICEPELEVYKSKCADDEQHYMILRCLDKYHDEMSTVWSPETYKTLYPTCRIQAERLGMSTSEELTILEESVLNHSRDTAVTSTRNNLQQFLENFEKELRPYMERVLVLCGLLLKLINTEMINENAFVQKMEQIRNGTGSVVDGEVQKESELAKVSEIVKQRALRKKRSLENGMKHIIEQYKKQIMEAQKALAKLKNKTNKKD